ncbi:hypothetical protein BN946_scf184663.g10 [Trametes cinnabarina]|uniref:Elongation factor 1 alpha-like protein n=1 Tax=Pycnoporus cinnabarinus TaxID=5643 RepID=A0A060SQ36_PYCCI|nr:hypothetical protein BN946_scf184663.g10 [Trametes cinnabarina]
MSRHRFVRNIDIHEELEDDIISDDGEADLSPEDYERMMNGLEQIRATLGDESQSALTDQDIKDSLYEYYFDVEQAITDLLGKQERRFAARERQDWDPRGKPLPPPPLDGDADWSSTTDTSSGRHNIPLVRLTASDYLSSSEQETTRASTHPGTLYTITEITELSEDGRDWEPSPRNLPAPLAPYMQPGGSRATLLSSVTTDYGQIVERPSLHPDDLPPSPSPSALQRLSYQERSEAVTPSSRRTSSSSSGTTSAQSPAGEAPLVENLQDIPDLKSKSSLRRPPDASHASLFSKKSAKTTEQTSSEKKSKLSALASSRSGARSSVSSVSAKSYITETASDVTYPALRPSAASMVSLLPEKRLPSRPSSMSQMSESSLPSSMSRVVNEALQSALALEAMERETPKEPTALSIPTSRHPSEWTSTPSSSPAMPSAPPRAQSEVALSSSCSSGPASGPSQKSAFQTTPPPASEQPQPRQLSKLARLAQAKAQEQSHSAKSKAQPSASQPGLILPRSHTEYLIPTANGPTATTAITTTYQSLSNLLPKEQSKLPPSMRYEAPPTAKSSSEPMTSSKQPGTKQSKLAMKSKSARTKLDVEPLLEPPIEPVIEVPIFSSKTLRTRASPSAFASLLANDNLGFSEVNNKERQRSERKHDEGRTQKERGGGVKRYRPKEHVIAPLPPAPLPPLRGFAFDVPSPDDIVFNARKAAKEREKAAKAQAQAQKKALGPSASKKSPAAPVTGAPRPHQNAMNQRELDMAGLNLNDENPAELVPEEPPKTSAAIEKLIEEAKATLSTQEQGDRRSLSLVVIGHVDAGKSTLMGRLLYELGRIDEKRRMANERGSSKMGKSSFSWAWELDGTQEERERGITMDIALQTLVTPHRVITILDAPGHKDFIPNMISGASQADSALLVVDAAVGEFEAGFERGGQTREHLLLVRSLGVSQVIVAVNKLDQVEWSKARYEEICELLRPFLIQSGFHPAKSSFVPVAAMEGANLSHAEPAGCPLYQWYKGPTLVDLLDALEPPTRDINAPLRFPISNVFKGQTSGICVSGRVCGGVIVVGERLRIIPGDESATVKAIDSDGDNLPWAGAGSNVNLTLTGVDPISLSIGIFDIQVPITAGTSVELFHHSRDVPAAISRLIAVLDRSNGTIMKNKPRVLTKNMSAEVEISLRSSTYSGPASRALPIPIEPFSVNKDMGRILIRRGGETVAAGVVLELLS